jgi:hypothetical protein
VVNMPGSGQPKPIIRGHEQLQGIFRNSNDSKLVTVSLLKCFSVVESSHGLRALQVKPESCKDFENVWKNRKSTLLETPGFMRFALLKGDEEGEQTTYTPALSAVICGN